MSVILALIVGAVFGACLTVIILSIILAGHDTCTTRHGRP